VGLFEFLGTNLADLTTYYTNVHQTNSVPVNLISVDGSSTSCTYPACDDTEQTLDMTQALGMAPGLASLDVYISTTSDTAIIAAMTTHNPLPTTIGCSWGWSPVDPSSLDPYFQKMAAQGQNFFAASGDSSTWTKTGNSAPWPADDPNVVGVGGTDLVTASAAGPWSSETAWVDSGGGITTNGFAIPSWQQLSGVINSSNHGSTTLRNGPDVSANANFTFYVCADRLACTANSYGGTSFAAPMWAGYIALVNQQLVANSQPTIGFLNPTIYQQNVGSQYAADFHDITSGTSGSYSAVTGYDLVTGWGSPNSGLIAALTGPPVAGFSLSASPSSVSVAPGNAGSSTITSSVSGGFNTPVVLSASGQPAGVTVSFNPTSITGAGTSAMSITVGSSVAAGTYPITVTGTAGSTVHTTTVTLTVTGVNPSYLLSASPTSLTIARSSSGHSTITVTPTGGFTGTVSLSASGQGGRVTVSFSPSSVSGGSGSSTMTVTVNRRATTGTRTITITGTSGTTTKTTTVSLTVQ
jgi:kumamolisin